MPSGRGHTARQGLKLDEFQVGQRRPGFPGQVQAVRRLGEGIGAFAHDMGPAGTQRHGLAGNEQRLHGIQRKGQRTLNAPFFFQQPQSHAVFQKRNLRRFQRAAKQSHGNSSRLIAAVNQAGNGTTQGLEQAIARLFPVKALAHALHLENRFHRALRQTANQRRVAQLPAAPKGILAKKGETVARAHRGVEAQHRARGAGPLGKHQRPRPCGVCGPGGFQPRQPCADDQYVRFFMQHEDLPGTQAFTTCVSPPRSMRASLAA